ncbi:hemerythrin domain-containing protein [Nocardia sp. NPDC050406]|uniref:hemerythrin domain-containing protein n=1 Tax=Nocardia sp. NPDC050406 TaxID=3364318 RepID=UPI0037885A85
MATEQEQDVVELLMAQHNRIKQLLQQVQDAAPGAKREPFEDLVRLLAVHEAAEEEVVHPTSRRVFVDSEIVDARLDEEEQAKQELAALYDLGVEHREFDERFRLFAHKVIEHAEMEEKEEFGQVLQQTSQSERAALATAVRVAENTAPTRPHPNAGQSAIANVVMGPPLAVFDRVRDAVRDWRRKQGDN